MKYLCYLTNASASYRFALGLREPPVDSSIKIKEISMLSSFPKLRAEMFARKMMWGLPAANVDVQNRNPRQRR